MKSIKYLSFLVSMSLSSLSALVAQQTDVIKHASPVKVEKFNGTTFLATKNYFDGLGRPVQSIAVGASAQNGKDVVSFVLYDNMSCGDSTTYLPYVSASNNGAKVPNPIAQQQAYYQSLLPATDPDRNYTYARKQYDNSPLGLVLKQGSVGASNSFDGKPVQYEYRLNGYSDQIKELRVDNSGNLRFKGYYPTNSLSVHRSLVSSSTDQGHDTYEYVNSLGQAIASETRVSDSDRRITYYVYDDFNRLCYTIPSALESAITSTTYAYTPFDLKKYSYYTQYDERNRPIAEWFPGYGRTYYVYDVLNRVVLTQTNKLSQTNESAFVKYDSQNRPVMSGVIALGGSIGTIVLQSTMSAPNTGIMFESRGAALHSYTNQTYPTNVTESDILNVTYYDDYGWITNTATYGFSLTDTLGILKTAKNVTGLTTGTKTKVIGQSLPQWLTSVTYYDDDYNAIQTITDLWPSGKEIVSNAHNFNGQVVRTKVKQIVDNVTYEYNKWFDYDGYGRLRKVRQKITGDAQGEVVLAEYTYDDLGRVASKKIHNSKETTTYAYDIAGRNISTTSPWFSYRIGFDKSIIPNVAGRSDGLISQVTWSNSATGNEKAYAYTYDALKQYISASFYEKTGASLTASSKFKETIGGYDKAGNILSIQRTNASGGALHTLSMTYNNDWNGYTLMNVNGSAAFTYDANVNMTKDGSSEVQIDYNILGLPEKIYKGTDNITYIYSGRGEKIASTVGSSVTYYRSVMVYAKNGATPQQLLYMLQPEGLVAKEGTAWVYKYHKKDHLGNSRALLAVRNNTLVNEGQNTDYYPYGVAHLANNLNLNRYLLGGKEMQDASLGGSMLGYYDFGARFYNPMYGRWFNMDPARQFLNPFTYCGNNPIVFIDPDGREVILSGDEAEAIIWQLQQWMGDALTLSWDKETGLLSYTLDEDKKLRGNAKFMTQMIDSKSIRINVLANNTDATTANTLMIGGAFMGTNVTKDANGNVTLVKANQEVSPGVLGAIDAHTNTPGKMAAHELSEAYEAGLISEQSGKSSPRASLDGSIYEKAHKRATKQRTVYRTIYDANGDELQMLPDGSYPIGIVRAEWHVMNNGTKRIIQTLPSTILK